MADKWPSTEGLGGYHLVQGLLWVVTAVHGDGVARLCIPASSLGQTLQQQSAAENEKGVLIQRNTPTCTMQLRTAIHGCLVLAHRISGPGQTDPKKKKCPRCASQQHNPVNNQQITENTPLSRAMESRRNFHGSTTCETNPPEKCCLGKALFVQKKVYGRFIWSQWGVVSVRHLRTVLHLAGTLTVRKQQSDGVALVRK
jgi:hypothetical protein